MTYSTSSMYFCQEETDGFLTELENREFKQDVLLTPEGKTQFELPQTLRRIVLERSISRCQKVFNKKQNQRDGGRTTKKVPMLRNSHLWKVEGCSTGGTFEAVAQYEAGKKNARDKINTAGQPEQVFAPVKNKQCNQQMEKT